MGRGGLVAYVEAQLERDIALRRLPPCGQFGSEAKLARRYDVCRGTIREALRRLAARGLVVQRPGRKTRAVALDESLTLENLGLALHEAGSPQARWLLEGYFSLKRQVLVELLTDCCERASASDMSQLESMCFRLWDAARWEDGARCAQVEFDLLRLAARVASRPGHVLLVQSLQRAFLGGVAQLVPFMGGEALRQWANCAMVALGERDARALQHQLPVLLNACDERVMDAFAPAPQRQSPSEATRAQECLLDPPALLPEQDAALEARSLVTEPGLDGLAPARNTEVLEVAPRSHAEACPGEPDSEVLLSPSALGLTPDKPGVESANEDEQSAAAPEKGRQSEPPPTGSRGQAGVTVHKEGGPLHHFLGHMGRWAARLWRSIAHALGPPDS
ncbi:FadR/GntR family transcriptional regulator [Corallococcus carmarthensis]|uniref:GntR family transcriptional regulator n=1 Tax=Corallococcus carmarthensis TaxID=2316728 RepID=A0A3A8KFQ7_9BACT|nr:GntR family transcriptional regulator [Corallococcus carmarthensis]RKH06790.1 GntR family transcriptional regulator [Corallococcus carmarthensis]